MAQARLLQWAQKKKTYLHMPIKGKKIGKKFRKQGVLREIHTKIKISLCSHCINDYKGRWSGLRDLNPRSLGPKPSAIPNFAKPGYSVGVFSDVVKHVVKGYFRPEQGRSQEEKVPAPQRVFGLVDFTGANRAPAPKEGEIPTALWMLFQLNYLAGNIIPLSCPINRVTQLRKPVLLYTGNEEKAIPKFNFTPPRPECGKRVAEAGRIW